MNLNTLQRNGMIKWNLSNISKLIFILLNKLFCRPMWHDVLKMEPACLHIFVFNNWFFEKTSAGCTL